ncbi:MAG: hypothetical protein P0Y53_00845 [Candidatus Pseudobacter hemicellulosilyticus]|uniref:Receptor L-domain domain-containing protein n=1 Tax=Candidatus Pseudobacter hemicellulosilyticus TaxID=3121375 RepID=A0AAJ6BGC1_9BACT|nr:MAG: hypothetical protein P0Y53_00845 [Pseudobacter sp.]
MKTIVQYPLVLFSVLAVLFFGCEKEENELTIGDDYTLRSQAGVNAFTVTENIRTLTISGTDITDLSGLAFKNIRNLTIENTGITNLQLPALSAVTVSFTIRNNAQLEAIDGLDNFKFHSGALLIEGNPLLTQLQGLMHLKVFKGDLTITDNVSLGENVPCSFDTVGFCVVKYLMNNSVINGLVTLSNNHPNAVNDPSLIGEMGGGNIISYVLGSKTDVEKFAPLSDSAMDLRITGTDITDAVIGTIKSKLKAVKGTLTVENTMITTTETFFNSVNCMGSIILRNNAELVNPQGFKDYRQVNGDLIIENCPKMAYWGFPTGAASFSGIARIEGSLRLNPVPGMGDGGAGFSSLTYVGGDMEITGSKTAGDMWNMDTWYVVGGGIKHIGGSLIYRNHYKVNGLGGFQAVEYIGGDVTIVDNGGPDGLIPTVTASNQVGFCIVKNWVNNGVLKKDNPVIQLRAKAGDALIDINTLPSCN